MFKIKLIKIITDVTIFISRSKSNVLCSAALNLFGSKTIFSPGVSLEKLFQFYKLNALV